MASFQSLIESLAATKVKDVPQWALKNVSSKNVNSATGNWLENYGKKYFKKGSARPIVHTMLALGLLGYVMEYSHLAAHERQKKYH